MDKNIGIEIGSTAFLIQLFNEKEYKLYSKEKYFSRGRKRLHVSVWEHYNGKVQKGFHVHHKDGNTWNNAIDNLELIEAGKHLSEHGKKRFEADKVWFDDFHSKGIEKAKEWHKSADGIEWHKEHGKKCWIGREYKKLICQQCGKEYQTRHAGISKFCHNNCKAQALRNRRKSI